MGHQDCWSLVVHKYICSSVQTPFICWSTLWLQRAATSGVIIAISVSLRDCPRAPVEEGAGLTVIEGDGWKLATLAFIVGLPVAAEVNTSAVELDMLGNCGAAAKLAVVVIGSANETCGGDTMEVGVGCVGTGSSLEGPTLAFLTEDFLMILLGFADKPLASDETEAPLRSNTGGAVAARLTGARGTVFSLEAVAASGVMT